VIVLKNNDYNLKYIISLFNSKLMQFWYKQTVNEKGRAFAQVKTIYLKKIPIKIISLSAQAKFITLIDFILCLNESSHSINSAVSNALIVNALEEIIDGMVLELYFEEEMKSKSIDIIKLVEAELAKLKGNNINENIVQFYNAVSAPDSEIRNRILMFPIASPTILKPILQG